MRMQILVVLLLVGLAVPAEAANRRAFVTSVTGSGNISTWPGASGATALDKADAVCRARAAAAQPSPLPNAATYRAWISTASTDAYCHVQGLGGKKASGCGGGALPGGGPWYLANGITPFAATLDELASEPYAIYRPLFLDENLDEIVDGRLLTGTFFSGEAVPSSNCSDWTSASAAQQVSSGNTSASAYQWSGNGIVACNQALHLLCLEPGAGDGPSQTWAPGAIVFLSSAKGNGDFATWPESDGLDGLDGADRICQNLAATAHLPGPESFVAWLAAAPVDASDRILTNGPFRRLDSFPIAFSFADLVDGVASNSLHVDETGAYLAWEKGETWTGADAFGLALTANCSAWTSSASGALGREGWANRARTGVWADAWDSPCSDLQHLYCFSNRIALFWDGFDAGGDLSRWSTVVGTVP